MPCSSHRGLPGAHDPAVARGRAAHTQPSSLAPNPQPPLVSPLALMGQRRLLTTSIQLPGRSRWKLHQAGWGMASRDCNLAVPRSQLPASSAWGSRSRGVKGHEEPRAAAPFILSPSHPRIRAVQGREAEATLWSGGGSGRGPDTKEGIDKCFESPRATGPLTSPLEVDKHQRNRQGQGPLSTRPPGQRPGRGQEQAGRGHHTQVEHAVATSVPLCVHS